jgi:hypothetical protein
MKLRELLACVVLVYGSIGYHALAQGFNRRYDPLDQDRQENGWSIERRESGFLVVGTTPCLLPGNIYYNPLVFSLQVSEQGEVLVLDTFLYLNHAIYPGAWNCMNPSSDGAFISGGGSVSQTETNRAVLWKIQPGGTIEMLGEFGPEGGSWIGRSAIESKSGGFILVGERTEGTTLNALLIRTDSNGEELWHRVYGSDLSDAGFSIDTTSTDGYFVGGIFGVGGTNSDVWVFRIDAGGDTLWDRTWGTEFNDLRAFLCTKANGNPVVASGLLHSAAGYPFCYMAELDANNGSILWEREYAPQIEGTVFTSVKEVAPGAGHIAAGVETEDGSNFLKGLLLRTADNGDSLWMRTYFYYDSTTTNVVGDFKDVVPTLDGGFIACGTSYNPNGFLYPPGTSQDVWVVKVDSLGCIEPGCDIPLGITSQITNLKDALRVWPNPVVSGGEVTVEVTLPEGLRKEQLRVSVVSSEGKLVVEESIPPQTLTFTLRTSNYASGLYHVHLSSGSTWVGGTRFVVD